MYRKSLIYGLLAIFFALVAYLVSLWSNEEAVMIKYVNSLQRYVHTQSAQIDHLLAEADATWDLLKSEQLSKPSLDLEKERFTILAFQEDSLLFWSNNKTCLTSTEHRIFHQHNSLNNVAQLESGTFLIKYTDLDNNRSLFALLPLKFKQDQLGRKQFPKAVSIPDHVEIFSPEVHNSKISALNGTPILSLNTDQRVTDNLASFFILLLYFIAFVFLAIVINNFAHYFAEKRSSWLGILSLLAGIGLIKIILSYLSINDRFQGLLLFDNSVNTILLGQTLSDLLVNVVLILWILSFIHKQIKKVPIDRGSKPIRIGIVAFNYFMIVSGILLIAGVFKHFVFNSSFVFDFDNIFNLQIQNLTAVTLVVLFLFGLFLFTHKLMLAIGDSMLNLTERFVTLVFILLLFIPVIYYLDLKLPVYGVLLFIFFYVTLFDLFTDTHNSSFTWMVIWLLVFSSFSAILLFKYNSDKEKALQKQFAIELSKAQDDYAEKEITNILEELASNPLAKARSFQTEFYKNNYLFQHYKLSLAQADDPYYEDLKGKHNESIDLNKGDLRLWQNDGIKNAYVVAFNADSSQQEFISLRRDRKTGFQDEFPFTGKLTYRGLTGLEKFDYAIYRKNELVESNTKIFPRIIELLPDPGNHFVTNRSNGRVDLIHFTEPNTAVVIGREKANLIKPLSLFSYLFTLLLTVVLIFSILNTFFNFFSDSLNFTINRTTSLRSRIQLTVIAVILLSFIVIGFVTVYYFKSSSLRNQEHKYERKALSIINDVQNRLNKTKHDDILNTEVVNDLGDIADIHRAWINIYHPGGHLALTSNPNVFANGSIAPLISSAALKRLKKQDALEINADESIGGHQTNVKYISLQNQELELIAYLGIPQYPNIDEFSNADSALLGTLLNVYVFLLLLAGVIAIIIANSITHPLTVIGEKLKQVKIGRKVEPIEWKNQDELGVLIGEYNNMIMQLEESAQLLAKSEREGAWREMAKQVAHEIKNPLTPMKLSIQHLQRSYNSQDEQSSILMKKVTNTLIQQIDNLANIATEFSDFARMPSAVNERIDLNALVKKVFDLFKNTEENELHLHAPQGPIWVYADQNQLTQVFNNIVKNAIQSIPEKELGFIDISLDKEGDFARVSIKDNGSGIPTEMQERIFTPYFTTKSSGTGLGLAIASNIISNLNGKIEFQSSERKGTTFYISIPLFKR